MDIDLTTNVILKQQLFDHKGTGSSFSEALFPTISNELDSDDDYTVTVAGSSALVKLAGNRTKTGEAKDIRPVKIANAINDKIHASPMLVPIYRDPENKAVFVDNADIPHKDTGMVDETGTALMTGALKPDTAVDILGMSSVNGSSVVLENGFLSLSPASRIKHLWFTIDSVKLRVDMSSDNRLAFIGLAKNDNTERSISAICTSVITNTTEDITDMPIVDTLALPSIEDGQSAVLQYTVTATVDLVTGVTSVNATNFKFIKMYDKDNKEVPVTADVDAFKDKLSLTGWYPLMPLVHNGGPDTIQIRVHSNTRKTEFKPLSPVLNFKYVSGNAQQSVDAITGTTRLLREKSVIDKLNSLKNTLENSTVNEISSSVISSTALHDMMNTAYVKDSINIKSEKSNEVEKKITSKLRDMGTTLISKSKFLSAMTYFGINRKPTVLIATHIDIASYILSNAKQIGLAGGFNVQVVVSDMDSIKNKAFMVLTDLTGKKRTLSKLSFAYAAFKDKDKVVQVSHGTEGSTANAEGAFGYVVEIVNVPALGYLEVTGVK